VNPFATWTSFFLNKNAFSLQSTALGLPKLKSTEIDVAFIARAIIRICHRAFRMCSISLRGIPSESVARVWCNNMQLSSWKLRIDMKH
jgi:hypothetical protein